MTIELDLSNETLDQLTELLGEAPEVMIIIGKNQDYRYICPTSEISGISAQSYEGEMKCAQNPPYSGSGNCYLHMYYSGRWTKLPTRCPTPQYPTCYSSPLLDDAEVRSGSEKQT